MPIKHLDYAGAKILMEVSNEWESSWRINACKKEPWTVAFIEAIPQNTGAWFIDVGANVGPYSLVAVARDLNVLAVEPGYESFRQLCHNLALNNWLDRALCLCMAVADAPLVTFFHYADLRAGGSHHVLGGERRLQFHRQPVLVQTLDALANLCGGGGDLYVKIDVDGNEQAVLQGAAGLLKSTRLKGLMVEHQLEEEEPLTAYLTQMGWRLVQRFDEREGEKIPDIAYGLWLPVEVGVVAGVRG